MTFILVIMLSDPVQLPLLTDYIYGRGREMKTQTLEQPKQFQQNINRTYRFYNEGPGSMTPRQRNDLTLSAVQAAAQLLQIAKCGDAITVTSILTDVEHDIGKMREYIEEMESDVLDD